MRLLWLLASALLPVCASAAAERLPNIVIIFADDLGYGDLGCYGHPTIQTPNLDRMASEGMKLTQFYSAASVCTPSRAGLLTGRLPVRTGMCSDRIRVLFPFSLGGIQDSEITIAEALKTKGYATACIGKWHLGHLPQYLPMRHGFDYYYGLPYSNDMHSERRGDPAVPLMRNGEIIEQPVDQTTLTRRYTEESISFIQRSKDKPFLLYLAHTFPHVPLFASERFKGKSLRGLYGDVVEEVDWSVGEVLETIRSEGLAENTLVFFTSDNGPWLIMHQRGGSAGLLRDGKGCTYEGGMREPALAWWPGKIKPGTVARGLATTMDIFVTSLTVAGVPIPDDRVMDGVDMSEMLFGTGKSQRHTVFFYRGTRLMAVRQGPWKAHFITQPAYGPGSDTATEHDPPVLYQLEHDPGEQFDLAKDHPDVIKRIELEVQRHRATLTIPPSQLERVAESQ